MSRQVMDAVIIAAVLAFGAGYLYAQGYAGRTVIHPVQTRGAADAGLARTTAAHAAVSGAR